MRIILIATTRSGASTRLSHVDGNKVSLSTGRVHLDPLTTQDEGGIDLKKIAPKARVY